MADSLIPQTTSERLRSRTISRILLRVEREVRDEIPSGFPDETRAAILNEILPHSRQVLQGLTLGELRSGSALDRHIDKLLDSTRYLVDNVRRQQQRASCDC